MKERPILFRGPMVRAILAGTKTQTRREVKPDPAILGHRGGWTPERTDHWECPYGKPGDRLWVKETFCIDISERGCAGIRYVADNAMRALIYEEGSELPVELGAALVAKKREPRWKPPCKPSIFMRRLYSRITLEIVSVRVERLNDISEADAIAEGISRFDAEGRTYYRLDEWSPGLGNANPVEVYHRLWDSINGMGAALRNPWVWVVEFKRITP